MGLAEIGLAAVMDMADFDRGSKEYMDTTKDMGDETESIAGRLSSAFDSIGLAVVGMAGVITTAAIGALVALGQQALQVGLEFDEAFDSMVISTGGAEEEIEGFGGVMKQVMTDIPTDANTASIAISGLYQRLELTGDALKNVAEPLLEVTRLTGGSIQSNTKALAGVAQDWNIQNEDLAKTLDKVFVASQKTGANFGSLLSQMDNFGPILKSMGFGFEESIALLGGLEEAGVNVGSVMMGLRMATKKLAESGKPMNEAFAESIEMIKGAATETEALSIASEIFGSRSGIELTNAIRSGKLELEDLTSALMSTEDNIMKTGEATMDFAEFWQMSMNEVKISMEPLGTAIMGLIGTVVKSLTPGIKKFADVFLTYAVPAIESFIPVLTNFISGVLTKLVDWLGNMIPVAIQFLSNVWTSTLEPTFTTLSILWVTTLQPILVELWDFIGAKLALAFQFVSENINTFLGALAGIGVVLAGAKIITTIQAIIALLPVLGTLIASLFSPITLIVAAGALLGAAWASNFGGIRDTTIKIWNEVLKPILTDLWNWLKEKLPPVIENLKNFWVNVLKPALEAVWGFIRDSLIPTFMEVVAWLADQIPPAIQKASDFWNNVLKPALDAIWSFIKTYVIPILIDVVTWLRDNIPPAIQKVADFWNTVLKPALNALWDFLDKYVIPIFQSLENLLGVLLTLAMQKLSDFWYDTLKPALESLWDYISATIVPVLETLWGWLDDIATIVGGALSTALLNFKNWVLGPVNKAVEGLKNFLQDIKDFIDGIIEKLKLLPGGVLPTSTTFQSVVPSLGPTTKVPTMSSYSTTKVVNLNMGGQIINGGVDISTLVTLIDSRVSLAFGG